MTATTTSGPALRYYETTVDQNGDLSLGLAEALVEGIDIVDGELTTAEVTVGTRAVLVGDAGGHLAGRPLPPLMPEDGLLFEPRAGGVRARDNRLSGGAGNDDVIHATRFGMVNALMHATRAARMMNGLLADHGVTAIPPVRVLVGAHAGSRLPGYATGDFDRRFGRPRPFQGAHYRLSQRTSAVPELEPISATGEIHLGPGWRFRHLHGADRYLVAAAHNPATIAHEVGHHLCRHTADFRLNAERKPHEQRNGKTPIEEALCDYFAAALLGTGRPYAWVSQGMGRRRDVAYDRHREDVGDDADAHAAGTPWAAAWWRGRVELAAAGLLPDERAHDRALVGALLAVRAVAGRPGDRRKRGERAQQRSSPATMISAYLDALFAAAGAPARDAGARALAQAGLL